MSAMLCSCHALCCSIHTPSVYQICNALECIYCDAHCGCYVYATACHQKLLCYPLLCSRAVAASDVNKYVWTPALQDNVEIWLDGLKAAYPWTETLWQHEWINIKHKLVSLIALAFSVLFDQVPATLIVNGQRSV